MTDHQSVELAEEERCGGGRDDYATLIALGFDDDELQELGLWHPVTGAPEDLAEMYIRRSKKKDTVDALRGHVRDICRYARDEGKMIRHVWFEQRSASKAYVKRGEFNNATEAILDGTSKTLYVWKTSRLSRRGMGQVGPLLDEFDRRRARVVITMERLDSSKGSRMVLAILSEQAREQAKEIAEFTKNGIDSTKQAGRWPGGVTPYGLDYDKASGQLKRNAEYPRARHMAKLLLRGITPAKIANQFNMRGWRTRRGYLWSAQGIIHLSMSISWAGLIPDRERLTDEFGNPVDQWRRRSIPLLDRQGNPIPCGEYVVTFSEWLKIQAIIKRRSRPGTSIGDRTRGKRAATTLMTEVLKCPLCGGPMGNGGANYRCLTRINNGPSMCVGVATRRQRIDDAIGIMWRNHVVNLPADSPTILEIARGWLSYQDPAKEKRKQAVMAALDNAASRMTRLEKEFFVGGRMDESRYESLRNELEPQIVGMKAELEVLSRDSDLTPLRDGKALAKLWEREGIDGRRALVKAALVDVTLLPAKYKGDRTPIERRLRPNWRDKRTTLTDEVISNTFALVEKSSARRKSKIRTVAAPGA
ncbi:recombinase family protein [Streptomyces sp. CC224B]|uniref:recombinase family protein n=1 Tax=Streptomyces sp. CC224B TaxID=3044571 RepID=UPI0024A8859F|nr:recombinase family protein [Streptomyces sp. CC224B]